LQYTWTYDQENINWEDLSNLYEIAPLGTKNTENLQKTFGNSMYKCFVFQCDRLVGVGRTLADGVDCAYICDVAVHPEFQGTGIGKSIIKKLINLSEGHKKIILYANPGKEGFYKKLGFKRMTTAMAIFQDQKYALEFGLINDS
jgi:ribosomal protein S18 acetylase RimI-like enzyme